MKRAAVYAIASVVFFALCVVFVPPEGGTLGEEKPWLLTWGPFIVSVAGLIVSTVGTIFSILLGLRSERRAREKDQ